MSASIDRFLATGDAAKKNKTKTPATIRRVGLRCTNCGGSHNTRDCPYEKRAAGCTTRAAPRSGCALSATSLAIPSAMPGASILRYARRARRAARRLGYEAPDHGDISRLTAGAQREILVLAQFDGSWLVFNPPADTLNLKVMMGFVHWLANIARSRPHAMTFRPAALVYL